jgi:hypothetical protein
MTKEELADFGQHGPVYRKNIFFFFYCRLKDIMESESGYCDIANQGVVVGLFDTLLGGVKAGKRL